jgi:hypothetical protein
MNANSLLKSTVASDSDRPVQDEWGISDPQLAGMAAVTRTLSDEPAPAAASHARVAPGVASSRHCRFCTETLLPGARQCPLCLRDVASRVPETREKPTTATSLAGTTLLSGNTPLSSATPLSGSTPFPGTTPLQGRMPFGAVYTLESPAVCPECDKEISTIQILRVLRMQVSFTSTLPRKAYVIACPECRRLLSAGMSGIL